MPAASLTSTVSVAVPAPASVASYVPSRLAPTRSHVESHSCRVIRWADEPVSKMAGAYPGGGWYLGRTFPCAPGVELSCAAKLKSLLSHSSVMPMTTCGVNPSIGGELSG